jgi:hypothetical protein
MSAHAPEDRRALLLATLATVYVVWGSTYLAIRVVVETIPPLLGAGARASSRPAGSSLRCSSPVTAGRGCG